MFTTTHITILVHDQNETVAFYQKLGFTIHTDVTFFDEIDGQRRWLTMSLPGTQGFELVIIKATTEVEKALVGKQGGDNNPFITFDTDNCQKDYEQFKNCGIVIPKEPIQKPWGMSLYFYDNSGNEIYLCQHN